MPAFPALGVHRNPVRVSVKYVLMRGMRIGPRDDVHAQLAAAGQHFAERVRVAEVPASVMQRDFGRIESNASAGGETCRIRMHTLEVVEPERRIVMARIVFNERALHPAHRPAVPVSSRWRGRLRLRWCRGFRGGDGKGRILQEFAAVQVGHAGCSVAS